MSSHCNRLANVTGLKALTAGLKKGAFSSGALLIWTITICGIASGCSTTVRLSPKVVAPRTPIKPPARVAVAEFAEGVPEAVATSTGTLLALPLVSMKLSPEERQTGLVNALKEALRLAGYEPVAPSAAPGAPVLRCVARQMRFKNYTYTWPVVITWGNVELELILNAADGKVLWSRVYQEKYSDQSAMQDSMDKLLNLAVSKIVSRAAEDFTQPDFHRACCGSGPQ